MKIGVIGSGIVGETLANGFLKHGYEVTRASRSPDKLKEWQAKTGANIADFNETASWADLIVLAVKGKVAIEAIKMINDESLKNKTIIDATNPIEEKPPINGVLTFFTDINYSLMEILQKEKPMANFVKGFSSVGNSQMVNPEYKEGRPSMFICGDNEKAKSDVAKILDQFGWEAEDMGSKEAARAIEPLCMLWCISGFKDNRWSHAFKVLK